VCSDNGNIDIRIYVNGLFSWLSNVNSVGMASWTVLGLVEVYFVFRALIK